MADHEASAERPAKRIRLSTDDLKDEQLQRELRFGIASFVNEGAPTFSGILKQRYTDFVVNEVQPDGTVLHLRNLDIPKGKPQHEDEARSTPSIEPHAPQDKQDDKDSSIPEKSVLQSLLKDWSLPEWLNEPSGGSEPTNANYETLKSTIGTNAKENIKSLCELFGDPTADQITKLYVQHLAQEAPSPVVTVPMTDRAQRTQAHQLIRQAFSSRLDSVTRDDGSITISAVRKNPSQGKALFGGGKNARGDRQSHLQQGEFLHFTVYKENKDTAEVKAFLCKQLHVMNKRFDYAGTKDRRAVTTQRCSIHRMNVNQLHSVGKRLNRNTTIGDFEYKPNGLQLGQTGGNEFTITLRDAHTPDDTSLPLPERNQRLEQATTQATTALSQHGFLNYFGLQRFGTFLIPTSEVGMRMLQNNLEAAVDAILAYSPSALPTASQPPSSSNPVTPEKISEDDKLRAEAIARWREPGNAREALTNMPKRFFAEIMLMEYLSSRNGERRNDFQGALMTVPRQTRTLYLHAYQSLIFNKMASLRWQRYGDRVVEGDVILGASDTAQNAPIADAVDEDGEAIVNPTGTENAAPVLGYKQARPVTADEAQSGKFKIEDVVLPLPGHDVIYPAHELGQAYKDFMASDEGGGLDPHNMKRAWKDTSLTGEYRYLINRPADICAEVKAYRGDEQLVTTDLEEIRKAELRAKGQEVIIENEEVGEDGEGEEQKLAVVVRFRLGPGSFATMALRDLMGVGGCKEHKPEYGGRK